MPRLTNATTGVVVNVDDATAAELSADWKPEKKTRATAAEAAKDK